MKYLLSRKQDALDKFKDFSSVSTNVCVYMYIVKFKMMVKINVQLY